MRRARHTLLATFGAISLCLTYACTDAPVEPPLDGSVGTAATAAGDVLVAAGNISKCTNNNDEATAQLLDAIPGTVVALGDNAFPNGRLVDYQTCYGPTWGRHLNRTYAVLGNHEYDSSTTAAGAFDYFGSRAGPRPQGYYSFELGDWHVIVLNDNTPFASISAGSAQDQWLVNDLAANAKPCIIAMFHNPYFLSSNTAGFTSRSTRKIIWDRLYAAGADIVLNGQEHHYERFAPMRPDGTVDASTGIREFIVGTGGESVALPTVAIHPNSQVRGAAFGVLKLTLRNGSYDWEFVPVAGQTFTDSGTEMCSGATTNLPPVAAFTVACAGLACDFTDGSGDSDGTVVAWNWTFGGSATSTLRNPSHVYATAGTYTVGLTVTDDQGASASTSRSVTVTTANQAPTAAFTVDCTEVTCSFTDASTDADGQVVAWSWSFGDGGAASSQNPSHTYPTGGSYAVHLTVTDDQGGTAATSQTITVNRSPVANPGGSYRSEDRVSFDGSASSDPDGDTPLTYAWDFGDGSTGAGVAPTHLYTTDGIYTVTLMVTDAKGAPSAPSRTTATIANLPPSVNAGSDVTMAPGFFTLRATFSDPGANDAPWTYTISWGDGFSNSGSTSSQSGAITASHPFLVPGQYRVRVTVTDKDGGVGTDDLVVTVKLL